MQKGIVSTLPHTETRCPECIVRVTGLHTKHSFQHIHVDEMREIGWQLWWTMKHVLELEHY